MARACQARTAVTRWNAARSRNRTCSRRFALASAKTAMQSWAHRVHVGSPPLLSIFSRARSAATPGSRSVPGAPPLRVRRFGFAPCASSIRTSCTSTFAAAHIKAVMPSKSRSSMSAPWLTSISQIASCPLLAACATRPLCCVRRSPSGLAASHCDTTDVLPRAMAACSASSSIARASKHAFPTRTRSKGEALKYGRGAARPVVMLGWLRWHRHPDSLDFVWTRQLTIPTYRTHTRRCHAQAEADPCTLASQPSRHPGTADVAHRLARAGLQVWNKPIRT